VNLEEYEERMKDSKYKELDVTTYESGEDYVFISYRGNSWKTVLTEIVYKLQKEYKLRIYFDKEFASDTNIWIKQFIKNMDSSHCKACLCFIDEGYVTSYATLLELMHAMNPRSKLRESIFPVSFPINWGKLDSEDWNTGLGKNDPDNPGWEEEKRTFDHEFKIIKKGYPSVEDYYYEGADLRGCDCKDIMAIIQPKNKRDYVNEDAYYRQFIVDPLKKKCPSVFADAKIPEYKVTIENDGKQTALQIKEGECVPKQDSGVKDGFDFGGWFVSDTNEEWDFSTPIHKDIKIYAKWETADVGSTQPNPNGQDQKDEHVYTIFGQEYHAGGREQGKLMFDAFEALTTRYPEYAEQLTQRTSVAKAEDVKNANTKNADPVYFRGCKAFNIEGVEYLVGTSYAYKAKLSEIKGMFKICGVPLSEFVLDGEPLGSGHTDSMPPVEKTLWEYNTKGTRSKLMWNGETTGVSAVITVLKGSAVAAPSPNFEKSCKPAYTLKADLEAKGIIQNGKFTQDYTYDKVSTMINLLNGGSVSTPAEVKSGHLRKLDEKNKDVVKGNDLAISVATKLIEGTATSGKELDDNEKLMGLNESYSVNFDASKTVEEVGGKTVPSKKKSEFADGYNYHIYGIEYHAGRREQANLMYDTFNAIINKHPDKVEDIVANCTSVSKKSDILDFGTRNAMPPYFRMCKEFTVNGEVYVVGSSYDFENKIAQIYRMIDACGEDRSIFELEGFEQKKKRDKIDNGKVPQEEQFTGFEYTLWGISHTSNKMSDMMNDVFDLIAERYPDRIEDIAEDDTITAVARKEDIDEGKIQGSKTANQFAHFNKREHSLNGQIYYVNAGYNREGGIRQLCKMLIICDGNADGLKITKMPEKSSHSGGNTGKKGLGELL